MDGAPVLSQGDLTRELHRRRVGQRVSLGVTRDGGTVDVVVELVRGVRAFESGCDLGFTEDCVSLGSVLEAGRGVAPDLPRAHRLHERACEAGEASGCVRQGFLLERGMGAPGDAARGVALR